MGRQSEIELTGACPGDAAFELREGRRFCVTCGEHVHDLRGATRKKVLQVLEEQGGHACMWLELDRFGAPKLAPEPSSRFMQTARPIAIALGLAACGSEQPGEAPAEIAAPVEVVPPTSSPPEEPATVQAEVTEHIEAVEPPAPSTPDVPPPPSSADAPPAPTAEAPPEAPSSTHTSTRLQDHVGHIESHDLVLIGASHYGGGVGISHFQQMSGAGIDVFVRPVPLMHTGPGHLDPAVVARALARQRSAFRSCYQRQTREQVLGAGRIAVQLTIGESGSITAASIHQDTLGDAELARCVLSAARALQIGQRPRGGQFVGIWAIDFRPPE